jgi:hypothetical protein
MIVDPPGHRLPAFSLLEPIDQPWNHDRCHRAHPAVGAALIPDVAPAIAFIRSTAVVVLAAVGFDLGGAVCGANVDVTERGAQRLEQVFTERTSSRDRKIRVVRKVRHVVNIRDLAVKKPAHEKILRQADPAERLGAADRSGLSHQLLLAIESGRYQVPRASPLILSMGQST